MLDESLHKEINDLIASGSDINQTDDAGDTVLHVAVRNDDVSAVGLLIKNNADVNIENSASLSPLHVWATASGNEQIAESLTASWDGRPSAALVPGGNVQIAELLIASGADVNARDNSGNTPLHYAIESEYTKKSKLAWMSKRTLQVVEELIKNGADVNAANGDGDTPLSLAARTGAAPVENIEELVEIAGLLISNGADVNAANELESTPLHIAAHNSAILVARLLIENGADVNARDNSGNTPLHYAVESVVTGIGKHAHTIAGELIRNGANVNALNTMGNTPLHLAAITGSDGIIRNLIKAGADSNLKNSKGEKPEDYVLKYDEDTLERFLFMILSRETFDHRDVLLRKRKQSIIIDDYGIEDKTKWDEELEYFVERVLLPKIRTKIFGERLLNNSKLISFLKRRVDEETTQFFSNDDDSKYKEDMDPIGYEYFCAEMLKASGWQAKVTSASSDQGVDIFAQRNGISVVLQCKKQTSPVGNKAVQEAHAGKGFMGADYAVVVSNNSYTPSARKLASALGVNLLHHDQLHDLINRLIHAKKN